MTFPGDHDGGLEELLRSALKGEAEGISPAGDGLGRIQERIAARRSRRVWLRPVAVVGAAAVAAAAGFTAFVLTSHPDERDSVLTKPTTPVPSSFATTPPAGPSPSATVAPPAFPATAFYPFTSAAAEQSWEAQRGPATQPWIADPVAEAKDFVTSFVLADSVTTVLDKQVSATTADVTLGRTMTDGSSQRPVKVTTVRLQRFGKAWLVVGADDPNRFLAISAPTAGAAVTSPVTVSGPGFGADEAVQVDVRAIGAPWLTASRGQASFGNGVAQWSTTVAFNPPADPRGAVVVVEKSAADGGASRIAVTPVTFAPESTGYPAYFYGVKNGRVTKFSAHSGAAISYLTTPAVGGASDPQLAADRVYYLSGTGACANALRSVPTSGGSSTLVTTAKIGYSITSFAVTPDNTKTALFETSCLGTATPRGLLVSTGSAGSQSRTVPFDSFPPELVGDPAWEPDAAHLEAVILTGMTSHPFRYDAFAAKTWGDGSNPCSGADAVNGLARVLDVDTSGAVWVGLQNGDAISVERCIGGTPRLMFTVAASGGPADIAVAGSGTAVLVTGTGGQVWRWSQGGDVSQLSPSVPITQLTW